MHSTSDADIHQPGDVDFGGVPSLPEIAGRYRCLSELGRGGFGRVLLAEDDLLRRRVAVKLVQAVRRGGVAGFFKDAAFLAEARMVAKLEHPGIVPIYDIVETDEGEYCIVSRYVEGTTLREQLTGRRFAFAESIDIAIELCEALSHAHKHGIVHRDVKPANIMITEEGRPMLLDFGLARNGGEAAGDGVAAGTPGYMSPEQARGEDHLVNGRSDIFSVGAVFYELLTGKRAFVATSVPEQLQQLASGSPLPPRQVDSAIPKELERICLKALNPQIRSRYPVALDMASDLRSYLAALADTIVAGPRMPLPKPSKIPVRSVSQTVDVMLKQRVVPRGLRSFDEGDSEFFLALIPGPRDRFGLPESLRFWKQRIESGDPDVAFRVGVLYGPSGCGKSSLVRAGLLPRCADHVTVLYHECRDSGNAARLGRALHAKFPQLDLSESSPAALLQKLRHGGMMRPGSKLLIVLDQGEQWLRAAENPAKEEGPALLNALRQCDGARVQVLLLVRDDFWRGVARLLADADVELNNSNSALVDLFETRHAEMVLESFGRAYRCLPEDPAVPLPKGAREFIQQATRSLEQARRISPVKLALFADMFHTRDWTVASLRSVGGVGGVAVTFLEESFRGPTARGAQRVHEKAARQVLQLFVPEDGDVKGPARTSSALVEASGYASGSKEFQELIHVLDADLRLLTPVETGESSDGQSLWQLTHDYMVPALRQWLLARKADTLRGRAEIALGERAREWHHRPDSSRLPRVWEWLRLRLLTKSFRWTPVEQAWMHAGANRVQWWSLGCVLAIAAGWLILHEARGAERGQDLAKRVLAAPPDQVQHLFAEGKDVMRWMQPKLARAAQEPISTTAGLNARLALVSQEGAHTEPLAHAMLDADAQTFSAIRSALAGRSNIPIEAFSAVLADTNAGNGRKLRAFAALAAFTRDHDSVADVAPLAARWLITSENETAAWASLLRPAAAYLTPSLKASVSSATSPSSEKQQAALALARLHADSPEELIRLLHIVPESAVPLFSSALQPHENARELLQKVQTPALLIERQKRRPGKGDIPGEMLREAEESIYKGYANVLHAGLILGIDQAFWPHLKRNADRTLSTFLFINASAAGVSPDVFASRLLEEGDPGIRQALLLGLCGYSMSSVSSALQDRVVAWLKKEVFSDPDGGVHSSIITLMKRWPLGAELAAVQKDLPRTPAPGEGMGWWITPQGIDMRIIPLASGRRMALGACEVTRGEYEMFQVPASHSDQKDWASKPVINESWLNAARYCLWFCEKAQVPPDQWCYEMRGDDPQPIDDVILRTGYRLPTKAEWQMAAIPAGSTRGAWPLGNAFSMIGHFAWYADNSGAEARPVATLLPDSRGLWDMIGNASELVHELKDYKEQSFSEAVGQPFTSTRADFPDQMKREMSKNWPRSQSGIRLALTLVEKNAR